MLLLLLRLLLMMMNINGQRSAPKGTPDRAGPYPTKRKPNTHTQPAARIQKRAEAAAAAAKGSRDFDFSAWNGMERNETNRTHHAGSPESQRQSQSQSQSPRRRSKPIKCEIV